MEIGRFWRVTLSVFSHCPLFGKFPICRQTDGRADREASREVRSYVRDKDVHVQSHRIATRMCTFRAIVSYRGQKKRNTKRRAHKWKLLFFISTTSSAENDVTATTSSWRSVLDDCTSGNETPAGRCPRREDVKTAVLSTCAPSRSSSHFTALSTTRV